MTCKRRGNALRWWGDANTKLRWACCSGNCGATCSSTAETAASVWTSRDSALANCIGTLLVKEERGQPPSRRSIVVLYLDVHVIYTLPVRIASRHSRASGNLGDK